MIGGRLVEPDAILAREIRDVPLARVANMRPGDSPA